MAGRSYIGVPTLGAKLLLTNPGDILIDVIRRFQVNYEGCSDTTAALTASYQQLITHYGDDRNRLAGEAQRVLTDVLKRIFPTNQLEVSVTAEAASRIVETYNIVIKASVTVGGIYYTVRPTIKMSNGIPVIANDKVDSFYLSQVGDD